MMSKHRTGRARSIGGAAVVGALLMGGLGASATAAEEVVRDVVVKRIGKDGRVAAVDRKELVALKEKCLGRKAESDVVSGEEKNRHRTRVVICSDDARIDTAALDRKLVAALEKARTELHGHDEMSSDHRAEALAALEREIDRLRNKAD